MASLPFPCPFTSLGVQINMAKWYYLVVFFRSSACAAIRFIWAGIEGSCKVVWCQSWSESLMLLWVATRCDVPVSERGREGGRANERGCMQDGDGSNIPATLALIQLLQAEQHWLSPRSWMRGDQVKVSKTEQREKRNPPTGDRERWEVLEGRREERCRATQRRKSKLLCWTVSTKRRHHICPQRLTHAAEFIGNPTPASLCLDDPMKDNWTAWKRRRGEMHSAKKNTVSPNIAA